MSMELSTITMQPWNVLVHQVNKLDAASDNLLVLNARINLLRLQYQEQGSETGMRLS